MYTSGQNVASYHVYLVDLMSYIVKAIRLLPSAVANFLVVAVRVVFLALLGFAAWVRDFTDVQFGSCMLGILVIAYLFHCFPNKSWRFCKKADEIKEACTNEILEKEVGTHRNICGILERVRAALESKSLVETQAEKNEKYFKQSLLDLERKCNRLQEELDSLNSEKSVLEQELHMKSSENESIRHEFAQQLDKLQETAAEVKIMETDKLQLEKILASEQEATRNLEKENSMLRATVEIMTKQRKQLVEKHAEVTSRVAALCEENDVLSTKLTFATKEKLADDEFDRMTHIRRLTEKMQTSLSTAKGKLTKVGGLLNSDTSAENRSTRRRLAT